MRFLVLALALVVLGGGFIAVVAGAGGVFDLDGGGFRAERVTLLVSGAIVVAVVAAVVFVVARINRLPEDGDETSRGRRRPGRFL